MVAALDLAEEDGATRTACEAVAGRDRRSSRADGRHGFELVRLAGGWAFRTDPRCHAVVSRLFELPDDAAKLSPAAIECLAVIAYLQPVSRPQIAEVRGVNSDSTVRTLLERELITEVGRSSAAGGAILYGTTRALRGHVRSGRPGRAACAGGVRPDGGPEGRPAPAAGAADRARVEGAMKSGCRRRLPRPAWPRGAPARNSSEPGGSRSTGRRPNWEPPWTPRRRSSRSTVGPWSPEHKEYWLLNKPAGVLSAVTDAQGQAHGHRVRADPRAGLPGGTARPRQHGTAAAHQRRGSCRTAAPPRFHVEKEYSVRVRGVVGQGARSTRFAEALMLEDGHDRAGHGPA